MAALTASASIRDPQTFNRYSYVLNSPYKFTDALGLLPVGMSTAGFCGAEFTACSGDTEWGQSGTFADSPPVPPSEQADEGIAANHEAAHSGQQEAQGPQPPPPPSDRDSILKLINEMNSAEIAGLEMILGEVLSINQVGQNEYDTSQNTSGGLVSAPRPTGAPISRHDIQTSMFMFLLVMENRAADGNFGGTTFESVIRDGQVARDRGRNILQAFIDNRKRSDGLGGLGDVELAVQTIKRWSSGGGNNGVENLRQDFQLRRIDSTKILYWKAVVQPPATSLRSWRTGIDVTRVARTDFSIRN